MATFELVNEHFQALLKVDHSGCKRSIGRFLAIDGDYYWSAVKWDRDIIRIPGKCPFDVLDEWDCLHWENGISIRNGKLVSNSEKSRLHGFWRDDKLYRITAKNEMLKFYNSVACQNLINQYSFNYIAWESQNDYWTAFLIKEVADLQANYRFWTEGQPLLVVQQQDLTAKLYPVSEESQRLILLYSRDTQEFYDHKLSMSVRAMCGVNSNSWKKVWLAVLDQKVVLQCEGSSVELDKGLWLVEHPVVRV